MRSWMRAAPDGYRLGKQLYSSTHSEVYEAVRESDGTAVVLKSYLRDRATDPAPHARREHDVMRRVAGPAIPAALAVDSSTERPILVVERVPALLGEGPQRRCRFAVPAVHAAHGGVDGVPALGKRLRGAVAEAAAGAGDEDATGFLGGRHAPEHRRYWSQAPRPISARPHNRWSRRAPTLASHS